MYSNQAVCLLTDKWGLCWVLADMLEAAFNKPDYKVDFPSTMMNN